MGLSFIKSNSSLAQLKKAWWYLIMVMLYLAAVSPQHIYLDMQKYVMIGLMKLLWSNLSENIIQDIICIIIWSNMYRVSHQVRDHPKCAI